MPSTIVFENPENTSLVASFFAGWGRSEILDLIAVIILAVTLYLQNQSTQRTAKLEMAKVLTEAFTHNEMYEAITYFLKVSPYLQDAQGRDNARVIQETNTAPDTPKHRYRILSTLHHAERLYQTEKADTALFTSLITPDIVEVALCLYTLDGYINGVDEDVYKMVYKVFENVRRSYLEPYWYALEYKSSIEKTRLQHTRHILKGLQNWDRKWGDEGDGILTEKDLLLLDHIKNISLDKGEVEAILKETEARLNDLIERFQTYHQKVSKLKHFKSLGELYNFRGLTKDILEKSEEAIDDYTEAIKLNPQYAKAYLNRGVAKYVIGKHEDAIADYNQAIEFNPKDANIYTNRGATKDDLGKHEDAIADFNQAIEFNPKDANVYTNRGNAKDDLGKHEDAIDDYTQAIKLNPQYATAYNNRGVAYKKMAQIARSKGDVAKAQALQAKADADFATYERLTHSQ